MPEVMLKALAKYNQLRSILPADGGDCEEVLARFAEAGIDIDALAHQPQEEGLNAVRIPGGRFVLGSQSAVFQAAG